ncbi:MAG: thiolase family protein [Deltaproteobacteria bacterium]|nr:MAG: thiolase family protein [Deltaproteobacteria bacterium]
MNRVAVVGISDMKAARRRDDATFFQLAYDAAKEAVEDARLTKDDIKYCFFSTANENFNRQPLMGIYVAEALGWAQKPLYEFTNAGGASGSALSAAYNYVASGQTDLVLVLGGDKISDADAPDLNGFQNLIVYGNDCIFEVPFGTGLGQFALLCQAYMSIYGITEEQAAKVSVKNHGNALLNPNAQSPKKISVEDVLNSKVLAWPIKFLDCSLVSDIFAAVVFASEERAKELTDDPIWIKGVGHANDVGKFGWREVMNPGMNFGQAPVMRAAAKDAYRMAGITDPLNQIDVAQVQDGFTWLELLTYEMLSFCSEGEGGKLIDEGVTEMGGALPVNPGGGCIGHGHAYGGIGMFDMAEVVKQIRGEAGGYQVKPVPTTGLVETMGGSGMCVSTVFILERG